ncbi:MAG: hypothetical protein ACXAD7_03045 [Candidatus Kariarchaeaceae archaeon]
MKIAKNGIWNRISGMNSLKRLGMKRGNDILSMLELSISIGMKGEFR